MIKNKLLGLLTAIVLLCMLPVPPLQVHAESGRIGDDITWEISGKVLTLTGTGATYSYSKKDDSPLWPHRLECDELIVSEGITEIGEMSLGALNAEQITLPDSLRRIGGRNFNLNRLTQLTLPPHLEYIGDYAFNTMTNVNELIIPDSVKEIGAYAFWACRQLKSVTLPDTAVQFGKGVFSSCSHLGSIRLPDAMTEIPDAMFIRCSQLSEVNIPSHCSRIGAHAFAGTALPEIAIPAHVREIGASAFEGCRSAKEITMQEGVERLEDHCFEGCAAQEIHVPESVTYIGADCFSDTAVRTLTLPTHKELFVAENALPEKWLKTQEGFLILGDGILYQYREKAEPFTEGITYGKFGDTVTWNYADGTLTLSGTGTAGRSTKDEEIEALRSELNIHRIVIGEGITALGDAALLGVSKNIETVEFPDSLIRIGSENFANCSALKQITLPPHLESIGAVAFTGCTALTELQVPDSVTAIGNGAFADCKALSSVTLPAGLESLGNRCFYNCPLDDSIVPESCTEIGEDCFGPDAVPSPEQPRPAAPKNAESGYLQTNITWEYADDTLTLTGTGTVSAQFLRNDLVITRVVIGEGITGISDGVLTQIHNYIDTVELPDSLLRLGGNNFAYCPALEQINLPPHLKSIGAEAFVNCTALTEVQIPDSVKTIGDSAFSGCIQLSDVKLPAGLKSLGKRCFYNCPLDDSIVPESCTEIGEDCFGSDAETNPEQPVSDSGTLGGNVTWELQDGVLTISGTGATDSYKSRKSSPLWAHRFDCREIIVSEGITEIGDDAICTFSVEKLTLPDSLTKIGADTFLSFAGDHLDLPPHLESIGDFAFDGMPYVRELVIPETVKEIGAYAFSSSTMLKTVTLPDTGIQLGKGLFYNCPNLQSIRLPEAMTEIPDAMFNCCIRLREINLPAQCTRIGTSAFSGTALTEIRIPARITELGKNAFWNCRNAKTITMEEGVESLGECCFDGCTAEEIHVPESVTYIGANCFSDTAVRTLTLPTHKNLQLAEGALPTKWLESQEGYLILGDGILYQYSEQNASDVLEIPDGIKVIYPAAISGLSATKLILPDSVRDIRSKAIQNCKFETITISPKTELLALDCIDECESLKMIRSGTFSPAYAIAVHMGIAFESTDTESAPAYREPAPESDLFSFGNTGEAFGETYQMPEEAKQALLRASAAPETVAALDQTKWAGSCYGLSAVTVLVQTGLLPPSVLDPDAAVLHDVKPDAQAIGVINYYHFTQHTPYIIMNSAGNADQTQFQRLLRAVRYAQDYNRSGTPFIISIVTKDGGGHAVVGYGLESGEWERNGQTYNRRIRIWDSNYTGYNDDCCIYFDAVSLRWTLPAYGIRFDADSETAAGGIGGSKQSTALINHFPYPLPQTKGDLNGDQKCSAADAVLLARCCAEDETVPEYVYQAFANADLNGDGVVDLVDLRAIFRLI